MNDDMRSPADQARATGRDPIITHDDGDVIELPAPGAHRDAPGDGGQEQPRDDDGLLARQTPGLDPEATRRAAGPDWGADAKGDLEAE